jgi:hypothetical protein
VADSPGNFLNTLISKLGSPYGAERSIKLVRSMIRSERLLLSIHKDTLGKHTEISLLRILKELGFPDKYSDAITSRLGQAEIIHFGYEDYSAGFFYKCYLEFTDNVRQANDRKIQSGPLVHYAVKWDPQHPSIAKINHYYLQPAPDLYAVKQFLARVYADNSHSTAYQTVLDIIRLDEVSDSDNEMMVLSVTEEGSKRFSFDINLYDARLRLADIASQLKTIAEYFVVSKEEWQHHFKNNRHLQLGHLSGGMDEKDREFFTVYFGVEERGVN